MKVIFFGTPEYVVPILTSLHKMFNRGVERELIAVVTQEPKPVGRNQQIEYSEVDHFAHKHKIDIVFDLDEIPEADLGICASYGKIIPEGVISKFSMGILNVHPSILPRYRGASPIQATITEGDEQTGVTIFKMDKGMDTGNIVSSFKSEIRPTDTNETLRDRLFEETVPFLEELLPNYIKGKITLKPQDDSKATYTKIIKKEDGFIEPKFIKAALSSEKLDETKNIRFLDKEFKVTPDFIERYTRALSPWPGIYTTIKMGEEEKRLKLNKVKVEEEKLILEEVQLEGKNPVSFKQFSEGYPNFEF